MTNKAASALAHLRWSKLSPDQRKVEMKSVRSNRRPVPKCIKYKYRHYLVNGLCACGYEKDKTNGKSQ